MTSSIDHNYTKLAIDMLGKHPIFLVDDSDIIKPLGEKFENLGVVRDGSSRKKLRKFLFPQFIFRHFLSPLALSFWHAYFLPLAQELLLLSIQLYIPS